MSLLFGFLSSWSQTHSQRYDNSDIIPSLQILGRNLIMKEKQLLQPWGFHSYIQWLPSKILCLLWVMYCNRQSHLFFSRRNNWHLLKDFKILCLCPLQFLPSHCSIVLLISLAVGSPASATTVSQRQTSKGGKYALYTTRKKGNSFFLSSCGASLISFREKSCHILMPSCPWLIRFPQPISHVYATHTEPLTLNHSMSCTTKPGLKNSGLVCD